MEMILFVGLVALSAIAELVDSAIGMMYGTVLSPLLILLGFDPLITVPALVFSQAAGGFVAAIRHHNFGHANFGFRSPDFRAFLIIALPGLAAVAIGAFLAIKIDKNLLKAYIALLVFIIGLLVVLDFKSKYSWKKMGLVGFLSSFNKALSGGGYGPFVTGSQIVIGKNSKTSIGVTTLAEVPICLGAFTSYYFLNGFSDWTFLAAMTVGSIVGGLVGPHITNQSQEAKLKKAVGIIALILGLILALSVLGLLNVKGLSA